MKLRFISDPGHGWLEVPIQLIERFGIGDQISMYSYRRRELAYLEEDCDYSVFIEAARKHGIDIELVIEHQDPTPIRHYQRFC